MPFPSTFSSFNRPTPSDRLNSPSHSALHNTQSSAIGQLEAVIGTDASVIGTILGDLRNPNSGGGGHVQTANKGGTGQTSYTKGDVLVAQGASTLTKLAAGNEGEVLTVAPAQVLGVRWGPVVSNKVAIVNNVVAIDRWQGSVANVIFAASVAGSTLGTNNAIRFTGALPVMNTNANVTFLVRYGVNSIATLLIPNSGGGGSSVVSAGTISGTIINNSSVNAQLGFVSLNTSKNMSGNAALAVNPFIYMTGYAQGTASVNSSANQDLVITAQFADNATINSVLTGIFVVEKIA